MEIVCLQDGNGSTTAYCVPNVAGTVEGYLQLAKAIGPGHLIYGIQLADRLQTGKFKEFASLREMAASISRELLTHHRGGPICLIGVSFGAFLAVELAQQLVGHGRLVPLVAIVPMSGPSASFTPLFRIKHFTMNVVPWALRAATKAVTNSNYRNAVLHRAIRKLHGDSKFGEKFVEASWYQRLPKEHQHYIAKNDANLRNYRFEGSYHGKIALFRKSLHTHPVRSDGLEDYGWGFVTGASVKVLYIPGDGGPHMHHHPDVVHIANGLRLELTECDRSHQSAKSKASV